MIARFVLGWCINRKDKEKRILIMYHLNTFSSPTRAGQKTQHYKKVQIAKGQAVSELKMYPQPQKPAGFNEKFESDNHSLKKIEGK